jgi:zinc protease
MFEGTTRLSHADLLAKLDEAGQSYFNATTSRDATHYVTRVGTRGLEFVLWMEADRLTTLGASVTQARLDSVRKVVEQERLQSVDNAPYGMVGQFVEAALYPKGHPYRRAPIGTIAELQSITLDDLRRFFATNYVPDNATIAVVGDFDPTACKRWIDLYFKPIPRGTAARQPQPPIVFRPAPPRRITVEADVSQPMVQLSWSTPALAADGDDALDALSLLGPTLRRTLVEAHRVVEAGIDHPSSPLGSRFDVTGVGAPGANVDQMEADLREALAYVAAKPRLVDHLDAERRVLIGQLKAQLEDPSEIAQTLSFAAAELGDPDHLAREIQNLEALTVDGVHEAWRTYLDDYEPIVIRVIPTPGAPHAGRVVSDVPYTPRGTDSKGDTKHDLKSAVGVAARTSGGSR